MKKPAHNPEHGTTRSPVVTSRSPTQPAGLAGAHVVAQLPTQPAGLAGPPAVTKSPAHEVVAADRGGSVQDDKVQDDDAQPYVKNTNLNSVRSRSKDVKSSRKLLLIIFDYVPYGMFGSVFFAVCLFVPPCLNS